MAVDFAETFLLNFIVLVAKRSRYLSKRNIVRIKIVSTKGHESDEIRVLITTWKPKDRERSFQKLEEKWFCLDS